MKNHFLTLLFLSFGFNLFAQNCNVLASYNFNNQTAIDSSDNNNDGLPFKTTSTTDKDGNANQAFWFDGDSSNVALPNSLINRQDLSISMWIKADAPGVLISQQNVPIYQSGITSWTPILYINSDSSLFASFWKGNSNNICTNTQNLIDGNWHHIALIGDASSQSVYIDNVLSGTGSGVLIVSSNDYNYLGNGNTGSFWPLASSGYFPYQGTMDEVTIFDRALTSAEISDIYNANTIANSEHTMCLYTFNNQNSTDGSLYNNDGIDFKTSTVSDRYGNSDFSYYFDGDSSHIELPNSLLNDTVLTLSMWVKADAPGVLVSQQNVPIYQSGISSWTPILYIKTDGTLHASFWKGNNLNVNTNTQNFIDGNWHHIVLTGNSSSQRVYIDNVLSGTGAGFSVIQNVIYNYIGNGNTGSFWSGANTGYFPYNGAIDEIQILNKMLCDAEVHQLYNQPNPQLGTNIIYPKETALEFNIFPNPCDRLLQIQSSENIQTINIFTLEGRFIKSSLSQEVDVTALPSGTYLLQVITDKASGNKLFVKK